MISKLLIFKLLVFTFKFVYMGMGVHPRNLVLILPCFSWGLNPGHHTLQPALLPAEPSG